MRTPNNKRYHTISDSTRPILTSYHSKEMSTSIPIIIVLCHQQNPNRKDSIRRRASNINECPITGYTRLLASISHIVQIIPISMNVITTIGIILTNSKVALTKYLFARKGSTTGSDSTTFFLREQYRHKFLHNRNDFG